MSNFNFINTEKPLLTEPGVMYFLNESLKQCHKIRENYYNLLFNIILTLTLLSFIMAILFYKYKGQLTPEEKKEKSQLKQYYILEKIKNFENAKIREHQNLITGLPIFSFF